MAVVYQFFWHASFTDIDKISRYTSLMAPINEKEIVVFGMIDTHLSKGYDEPCMIIDGDKML